MKAERIIIIGSIAVGICYLTFFIFLLNSKGPDSASLSWNEIGDAFGALNALFTSLAFVFLVYTTWLQREDLKIQQDDLKETRDEIKKANAFRELSLTLESEKKEAQEKERRNAIKPIIQFDARQYKDQQKLNSVLRIIPKRNSFKIISVHVPDQYIVYGYHQSGEPIGTKSIMHEGEYEDVTFEYPIQDFGLQKFVIKIYDIDENKYSVDVFLICSSKETAYDHHSDLELLKSST